MHVGIIHGFVTLIGPSQGLSLYMSEILLTRLKARLLSGSVGETHSGGSKNAAGILA